MAIYFKCPHCGLYFIDMFGEHVKEDTDDCYINGPYICPECETDAIPITDKEYTNSPIETRWKGYNYNKD